MELYYSDNARVTLNIEAKYRNYFGVRFVPSYMIIGDLVCKDYKNDFGVYVLSEKDYYKLIYEWTEEDKETWFENITQEMKRSIYSTGTKDFILIIVAEPEFIFCNSYAIFKFFEFADQLPFVPYIINENIALDFILNFLQFKCVDYRKQWKVTKKKIPQCRIKNRLKEVLGYEIPTKNIGVEKIILPKKRKVLHTSKTAEEPSTDYMKQDAFFDDDSTEFQNMLF